jgi:perosamine synthetase
VHEIPIAKCELGLEEIELLAETIRSGWLVQGPRVQEFERLFSSFTGASHSVACTSCTTALHLALATLGVGPGDEVIVPAFTWISTANAVEYCGGTPIFCDIDLSTFNIDASEISDLVNPRTKGLIPVHLFGLCADMEPILEIAATHELWIVEDAACALGSYYKERHAGTMGEVGCFSFHPRKSITTGEGGMLVSDRKEWSDRVRELRNHGAATPQSLTGQTMADYPQLGFNYRMTDLQAAVGVAQMAKLDAILQERARIGKRYHEAFSSISWFREPQAPAGYVHSFQSYVGLVWPEGTTPSDCGHAGSLRDRLMQSLKNKGISTRQGTHAPALCRYYREKYALRPEMFPHAHAAELCSLALPLYSGMTDSEIVQVVDAVLGSGRELGLE